VNVIQLWYANRKLYFRERYQSHGHWSTINLRDILTSNNRGLLAIFEKYACFKAFINIVNRQKKSDYRRYMIFKSIQKYSNLEQSRPNDHVWRAYSSCFKTFINIVNRRKKSDYRYRRWMIGFKLIQNHASVKHAWIHLPAHCGRSIGAACVSTSILWRAQVAGNKRPPD